MDSFSSMKGFKLIAITHPYYMAFSPKSQSRRRSIHFPHNVSVACALRHNRWHLTQLPKQGSVIHFSPDSSKFRHAGRQTGLFDLVFSLLYASYFRTLNRIGIAGSAGKPSPLIPDYLFFLYCGLFCAIRLVLGFDQQGAVAADTCIDCTHFKMSLSVVPGFCTWGWATFHIPCGFREDCSDTSG